MGGDFAAFWRLGGARAAKLGLRGGFVHPLTGRTIGDAAAMALLLAQQRDFSGGALHDLFEAEAKQVWKQREFLRERHRRDRRGAPPRIAARSPRGSTGSTPARSQRLQADRLGLLDRLARPEGADGG